MQNGLTSEYNGKTYYHDTTENKEMFDRDPERYISMAREKGLAA